MRTFIFTIAVAGALWVGDAAAFGGRYSHALWVEASYHGHKFKTEVQRYLNKVKF